MKTPEQLEMEMQFFAEVNDQNEERMEKLQKAGFTFKQAKIIVLLLLDERSEEYTWRHKHNIEMREVWLYIVIALVIGFFGIIGYLVNIA